MISAPARWTPVRISRTTRCSSSQPFSRVGRIHLIAAPVAKLGRGLSRLPERSVEARTIFRGIRKNWNILELVFIQRFTNGSHPAIHHVRRSNDVGARARVRQ